jgi:hypothetical protein
MNLSSQGLESISGVTAFVAAYQGIGWIWGLMIARWIWWKAAMTFQSALTILRGRATPQNPARNTIAKAAFALHP